MVSCENGSAAVLPIVSGKTVVDNSSILRVNEEIIEAIVCKNMKDYQTDIKKISAAADKNILLPRNESEMLLLLGGYYRVM